MKKMFVLLAASVCLLMQSACTQEKADSAMVTKEKKQQAFSQQSTIQNISTTNLTEQPEKNASLQPDKSDKIDRNNTQATKTLSENPPSDSEIGEIVNDLFFEEKAEFLNNYNFIFDIAKNIGS